LEARTGLSDNRARWYEPGTGKFINEDPSGFRGGDANLFRYVGNDPLNQVDPSGLAAKWASYGGGISTSATMGSAVTPLGWSVLGQQASLTLTTLSPSVSAMAYAGLRAQPAQATAGVATSISISGGLQLMGSGTRPIVTPVSQSVAGQAYSGVSAGGEPTFAQGFATSLGRNAVGIATGAAVGLGIAAAVPAAVLASPFVVGAAVFGAAYGGYRTGLAAYQGWTRNEVDPWTGAATGRTLTRAEQGAATGDFVAGGLTIGAGAAKAVASRFSAAPKVTLDLHRGSGLPRGLHDQAIDVVSGRKPRLELLHDLTPDQMNQMSAFFRRQAMEARPEVRGAFEFNMERARFLEQGGPQPPGNLNQFRAIQAELNNGPR